MNCVLLRNGALLDTVSGEILGDRDVLVDGDRIVEISPMPIQSESTASFDLRGRVLMPGLCDAHVHVAAVTADLPAIHHMPVSYVTAGAAQIMRAMLMRGFTTVRDGGGADYGMALAVEEGQLIGPRILFSGHALSQTGGHGDWRSKGDHSMDGCACSAVYGRICDGVPELRKAARDEIRKGASQIKIMASGGLSSPTDRADGVQFAMEEIKAAVEEADAAGIYVMAHAAPARAVKRALQFGVRSIEHGHYMDEECLDLLIEKQAFYVPTMAIRYTLLREGLEAGFPAVSHAKLLAATGGTIEQSQRVFERAHRRGIKMVYGTDLLGNPPQASDHRDGSTCRR